MQRLRTIGVDGGSHAQWRCDGVRRVQRPHPIALAVGEHTGTGLQVVQHRWQVERTLAWLLHDRRQSRDDERVTVRSDAMVQMSMIRLFLKRFAEACENSC